MVIQNNLAGLNAYNKLNANVQKAKKASEVLASGYRINSAANDASGLAVSEKMRAQIRGLKQATRNCQDGINLIQTFEGALDQSHDIIKRCTELAAEAANGTYDDPVDRAALQSEFEQLRKEIDAISDTDFNGLVMLNGGTLASFDPHTGYNWVNPGNLKWREGTIINRTEPYTPDFTMEITKLPALDELTLVTDDEAEALKELGSCMVSASLDKGRATFSFDEPIPEHLTIETRGNAGIISVNTAGGVVEIAKVTLPGVSTVFKSESYGRWIRANTTTTTVSLPGTELEDQPKSEINFTTNGSDPFPLRNGDGAAAYDQRRKDYDEWLTTIPMVQFTVTTDDLDKFTIPPQFKDVVYDYSEDKIYKRGDIINVISRINGKTVYTPVTVNWDPATVRPGSSQNVTQAGYTDSSYSQYYSRGSVSKGDYASTGTVYAIGTVSKDIKQRRFLAHGAETFTITYQETSVDKDKNSVGVWSITITNYDDREGYKDNVTGTTLRINSTDNPKAVSYFFGVLGLDQNRLVNDLSAIHKNDNQMPSTQNNPDGTPKYIWTLQNNRSYTMSFTTIPNTPSRNTYEVWSTSKNGFTLSKYNPDNPGGGGLDYDLAVSGTYTYHNANTDEGVKGDPGYWTGPDGEEVNLEDVGIYISDSMRNSLSPLHDGFSITVSDSISGPSGKISGVPELAGLNVTEILAENDLGDLTYSDTLALQTNSRTKDSVEFTFIYHSEAQGDLVCNLNCSSKGLGLDALDISNQENANLAIDRLNQSLNKVSMVRGCFGAAHNRLEHKISNISTTDENVTASESYIRDADMALEIMEFTKSQVVMQTAQSMLSQANQVPQSVLQLIR